MPAFRLSIVSSTQRNPSKVSERLFLPYAANAKFLLIGGNGFRNLERAIFEGYIHETHCASPYAYPRHEASHHPPLLPFAIHEPD